MVGIRGKVEELNWRFERKSWCSILIWKLAYVMVPVTLCPTSKRIVVVHGESKWEQKTIKCLQKDPKDVLKDDVFQKDMNNNEDYRCYMIPLYLNARGNNLK